MSVLRRRALIEQGDSRPYWYDIEEDWDYIIDQTGKYENPIIVNENNLYHDKLRSISNIRDMSKLVVGYYDEASAKLIWEPLDNSSKSIVIQHPTSAYPINIDIDTYLAEHPTADVFMKLPEFWWRCWNINDNPDIVAFKFVTEEPVDDNTWFHWDGNIFIGVYKCGISTVNSISVLRSISGTTECISKSCDTYRTFARNKGAGYRCVTYEAHQIMALLFFGFYGHTDDGNIFGSITSSSYLDKTGATDIIGINKDDNVIIDSNRTNHSYWGLENWCRGHDEHIDNIRTLSNDSKYVTILIDDISGTNKKSFSAPVFYSYANYISKLMLPEIIGKSGDGTILFKGYFKTGISSDLGALRMHENFGGLVGLNITYPKNRDVSLSTSRLQYEGNNEQNTTPSSATSAISSYVLDQTNSNGNPDTAIVFDNDNSVILAIKAASDFYACENKDWGSDTPEFIKMSKNHKLTTAGGVLLDANNYDIFMKLPEFWWKCENVDNNEDKVRFSFTMTNPNDNTWFHWEGNTFIGVYKSYFENNKFYSRSGVKPTYHGSAISGVGQTYARNRGDNFTMMTYEIHQIMCILLWGYRDTLDSKKYYYNSQIRDVYSQTGITNSNGFGDINSRCINLWGLEDWFGNGGEIIQNLKLYVSSDDVTKGHILVQTADAIPTTIRSFECNTDNTTGSVYSIGKFIFGSNGDVIPKINNTGILYKNEVYTFQNYNTNENYECVRAPFVQYSNRGFASICDIVKLGYHATRLCYKGNYTIASES